MQSVIICVNMPIICNKMNSPSDLWKQNRLQFTCRMSQPGRDGSETGCVPPASLSPVCFKAVVQMLRALHAKPLGD